MVISYKTHTKLSEVYFLLGLSIYTIGQFLIFIYFNDLDALHAQEPIDFAHWCMLIGVLLLIPQTANFPKTKLNLVGTPILILGIGLIIGMCVIDFIFWSIKLPEQKNELAVHLTNTPAIWIPFMSYSGKIFTFGLLISSFGYYKISMTGTVMVLLGTLIVYMPYGWDNVPGYMLLTVGFYLNFNKLKK